MSSWYNVIGILGILFTCLIGGFIFIPLLAALHLYVIIVQTVAGIKANNGEYFRYPAIIRFIK
jgi:uncharacterized Tic20 family protein